MQNCFHHGSLAHVIMLRILRRHYFSCQNLTYEDLDLPVQRFVQTPPSFAKGGLSIAPFGSVSGPTGRSCLCSLASYTCNMRPKTAIVNSLSLNT